MVVIIVENKVYSIYVATNKITGHKYVGATSDIDQRKNSHRYSGYGGTTLFSRAIQCFKFENFLWEVVYTSKDKSHIFNEMEAYFIFIYKSYSEGYNIQKGNGTWADVNTEVKADMERSILEYSKEDIHEVTVVNDPSRDIEQGHVDFYNNSEIARASEIRGKICGYCGDSRKVPKGKRLVCATCFPGGEFLSVAKIKKKVNK